MWWFFLFEKKNTLRIFLKFLVSQRINKNRKKKTNRKFNNVARHRQFCIWKTAREDYLPCLTDLCLLLKGPNINVFSLLFKLCVLKITQVKFKSQRLYVSISLTIFSFLKTKNTTEWLCGYLSVFVNLPNVNENLFVKGI